MLPTSKSSCFHFWHLWHSWQSWQSLSTSDNKRRFVHSPNHSAIRRNAPVAPPETNSFPPRRGWIVLTNPTSLLVEGRPFQDREKIFFRTSSRRAVSEHAQLSACEQAGGTLCLLFFNHKHKVLRSYSPAEGNAGSLDGPQDDELSVRRGASRGFFQTDPLPRDAPSRAERLSATRSVHNLWARRRGTCSTAANGNTIPMFRTGIHRLTSRGKEDALPAKMKRR
jgi:hypothetical protein